MSTNVGKALSDLTERFIWKPFNDLLIASDEKENLIATLVVCIVFVLIVSVIVIKISPG